MTAFAAHTTLWAESYLLSGTFAGDSRYSVQKVFGGADDELCWAASASNMLQFWQDQWTAAGGSIPAGTPNGQQSQTTYSTDIFATYVNNWTNDGGFTYVGMQWWLCDSYEIIADSSALKAGATGGAYWTDLGLPYQGFYTLVDVYDDETPVAASAFTDALEAFVTEDYLASLSIYNVHGGGHAIAIWGYEMTAGDLTGIWISDSDSGQDYNFLVDVNWDSEEGAWMMGEAHTESADWNSLYRDSDWFVGEIEIYDLPMIPEPSLYALLLSGVWGLLVLVRRRPMASCR